MGQGLLSGDTSSMDQEALSATLSQSVQRKHAVSPFISRDESQLMSSKHGQISVRHVCESLPFRLETSTPARFFARNVRDGTRRFCACIAALPKSEEVVVCCQHDTLMRGELMILAATLGSAS